MGELGEGKGFRLMQAVLAKRSPKGSTKGSPESTAAVTEGDPGFGLEFSKALSVAEVQAQIRTQQKPAVVFVTRADCGACANLKSSVKGPQGAAVRAALGPER